MYEIFFTISVCIMCPYYCHRICGGFNLEFFVQVYGTKNSTGEVFKWDKVENYSTGPFSSSKRLCMSVNSICNVWKIKRSIVKVGLDVWIVQVRPQTWLLIYY